MFSCFADLDYRFEYPGLYTFVVTAVDMEKKWYCNSAIQVAIEPDSDLALQMWKDCFQNNLDKWHRKFCSESYNK